MAGQRDLWVSRNIACGLPASGLPRLLSPMTPQTRHGTVTLELSDGTTRPVAGSSRGFYRSVHALITTRVFENALITSCVALGAQGHGLHGRRIGRVGTFIVEDVDILQPSISKRMLAKGHWPCLVCRQ